MILFPILDPLMTKEIPTALLILADKVEEDGDEMLSSQMRAASKGVISRLWRSMTIQWENDEVSCTLILTSQVNHFYVSSRKEGA